MPKRNGSTKNRIQKGKYLMLLSEYDDGLEKNMCRLSLFLTVSALSLIQFRHNASRTSMTEYAFAIC